MEVDKLKEFKIVMSAVVTSEEAHKITNKRHKRIVFISMWTYACVMFFFISGSLLFTAFSATNSNNFSSIFEIAVFVLLSADYLMRIYTADIRIKRGRISFILYFLKPTSLILLVSILPSLYLIDQLTSTGISVFNTLENMKFLRIFRIILLLNIFPSLRIFKIVLLKERKTLSILFIAIITTILLFALAIYTIEEPNAQAYLRNTGSTRDAAINNGYVFTYWQAIYYSTITLTTIGFGDFHPHTTMGQVVTTFMSIIGIAIVATPTGIIAGGFVSTTRKIKEEKRQRERQRRVQNLHAAQSPSKDKD